MNIIIKTLLLVFIFTGCSQTKYSGQSYNVSNNSSNSYNTIIEKDEEPTLFIKKEVKLKTKIAIVFPSYTIGKYALEATNSINTYLISRDEPFELVVYDIVTQNKKNILNVMEEIKKDNITKVIAMITKEDVKYLKDVFNISNIQFYLPLVNKGDIINVEQLNNLNLTFGAIDYKKQFEKLLEYANGNPLVELYGNSGIGRTLHQYLKNENIRYSKKIDDNNGRYKFFLRNNKKLDYSYVFLNTPIVKSSILLSAINSQELLISKIMSTQLNYTPLLFSLTQTRDRKKLVIANSIGKIPEDLEEYNNLIGNNLNYSWVNYSTIIGIEYLMNDDISKFEDISLHDNQIIYPVKLYSVQKHSFQLIK
ncbi:DDE transposase [Arcobacter sp. 15-2]|uniref:hypothetical protein n=1 Tax=Arcobacter sp. 15-2 TaxID=3374109 RepID=UPI00399C63FF